MDNIKNTVTTNGWKTKIQRNEENGKHQVNSHHVGKLGSNGWQTKNDSRGSHREDWARGSQTRKSDGGIIDQLITITRHQLVCAKNTVRQLENYLETLESIKNSENE